MAEFLIQDTTMTNIADAIREMTGITNNIYPGSMPNHIRSIQNTVSDTTGVPTYVIEESDRVVKEHVSKRGTSSTFLTFVAMSDMHELGDNDSTSSTRTIYRRANLNAGQAAKLIADNITLDFFVNLGDLGWFDHSSTTTADGVYSIVRARGYTADVESVVKSIILPGNHDVKSVSEYIDSDVVNGLTGAYQYFDLSAQKIRVICLNTADNSETGQTEGVSNTQLQWFAEALDLSSKSDAKNWGIVILSHHPIDWGTVKPVANCLYAYLNGKTFSSGNVSYNYSGKNAARVIANFHGHTHCFKYSYISSSSGTTNVYRVAIPNACYGRNNEYGQNGNTEFGETTVYNKTDNSAKNTALCLVSVDLNKKIIYADCYGAGANRTISYAIEGEDTVYYSVTKNMTNATISENSSTIEEGSSYTATITANADYKLDGGTIIVKMGGTDITSSAYSNGTINISNVTGNIEITVVAVSSIIYNVTNLVPTSEVLNSTTIFGTDYNGNGTADGYQNGVYLSSSGGESSDAACVATGYIPYEWKTSNIIYIRGADVTSASHVRIYGYIGKTSTPSGAATCSGPNLSTYFTVDKIEDKYYKLTPLDNKTMTYIRFSLIGTGENLIITVNEEIVADSGESGPTYYSISYTMDYCSSSNSATSIEAGSTFTTTITANTGYENASPYLILMGGVDLAPYNDYYNSDTGVLTIPNVNGNLELRFSADVIEVAPAYTNLVKTSTDSSGAIYNTTGYKTGYRLNSSGTETATTNAILSGFIPYKGQVIRLWGSSASTQGTTGNYVALYNSSYNKLTVIAGNETGISYEALNGLYLLTLDPSNMSSTIKTHLSNAAFIRGGFGLCYDPTKFTITLDEDIT